MSGNNNVKPVAGPTDVLATFWAQCFELSDRQARTVWEVMQTACDPQQMQSTYCSKTAGKSASSSKTGDKLTMQASA